MIFPILQRPPFTQGSGNALAAQLLSFSSPPDVPLHIHTHPLPASLRHLLLLADYVTRTLAFNALSPSPLRNSPAHTTVRGPSPDSLRWFPSPWQGRPRTAPTHGAPSSGARSIPTRPDLDGAGAPSGLVKDTASAQRSPRPQPLGSPAQILFAGNLPKGDREVAKGSE